MLGNMGWRTRRSWAWGTLALAGWLVWQFSPAQALLALVSLSDPAKLATLGERGANSRLNKLVYWLDQARVKGLAPDTAVGTAQVFYGIRQARALLVKESLLNNLQRADEWGLLTAENQDRLRGGRAPVITRGTYRGKTVEVDHIVPISLAPECGNELANLEWLPQPLNRSKSNTVGPRQLSHAQRLFDAGLLTRESFDRVKRQAQ